MNAPGREPVGRVFFFSSFVFSFYLLDGLVCRSIPDKSKGHFVLAFAVAVAEEGVDEATLLDGAGGAEDVALVPLLGPRAVVAGLAVVAPRRGRGRGRGRGRRGRGRRRRGRGRGARLVVTAAGEEVHEAPLRLAPLRLVGVLALMVVLVELLDSGQEERASEGCKWEREREAEVSNMLEGQKEKKKRKKKEKKTHCRGDRRPGTRGRRAR